MFCGKREQIWETAANLDTKVGRELIAPSIGRENRGTLSIRDNQYEINPEE